MELHLLFKGNYIYLVLDDSGWFMEVDDFWDYPLPRDYPDNEIDRAAYIFMTSKLWQPVKVRFLD